jgi:large conductance mechanosensitive channel
MQIFQEFKTFAMRGNAVELAVGVIIGAAFGAITNSLVNDILTPPLGLLIDGIDFSKLAITIKRATASEPAVVIGYGKFLQSILNFFIVALAMFLAVKATNALNKSLAPPPETPADVQLLTEIRDLLKR